MLWGLNAVIGVVVVEVGKGCSGCGGVVGSLLGRRAITGDDCVIIIVKNGIVGVREGLILWVGVNCL